MSTQFLISFCNNKKAEKSGFGLLAKLSIVNSTPKLSEIKLDLPSELQLLGATGLLFHENKIFVICQSKYSVLLILSEDFQLIDYLSLRPLKGVHSILMKGNKLILVATKQDKIVELCLTSRSMNTIFDLGTEKDTIHLNSICHLNGEVFASCFGNNEKEFWMQAENGYVFNIKNNQQLIKNIKQPHSLLNHNNQLYVCDSSRQRVINQEDEIIYQTDSGYVRGLYIDNDTILVGHSKGRVISHTNGKFIGNIADKGIVSGLCGLYVKNNTIDELVNCSHLATEIYDILPLNK